MVKLTEAGQRIGDLFAVGSFAAAVSRENFTSFILCFTALGTVLVPRLLDWFRQAKLAQREEHIKDAEAQRQEFIREREELDKYYLDRAMGIARLETQVSEDKITIETNRLRIAELERKLAVLAAPTHPAAPQSPAVVIDKVILPHPDPPPETNQ